MSYTVAVLVGSLRKESLTRKVAKAAIALAPKDLKFEFVEIGNLPHYNQDNEGNDTAEVKAFKDKIAAADAVLFATPEYNRSIPGVLKNALDTGSRPYGQSKWSGKPAAILSVSPGALGGFGANHHLRQMLTFLNMPALAQPEAYVGGAASLLDDRGELVKPETRAFLGGFMAAFADWIGKTARRPALAA
jgi:chromate reductase, NAD(P)H dehydrogenase (quinone)